MNPALLLPCLAGVLYAVAAILLKESLHRGAGPWRLTFLCNLIMALLFLPMLAGGGHWQGWGKLWQPLTCGLLFFFGQIFTFLAIHRGQVSIATPVLGTKILWVAVFGLVLFDVPVPGSWWIAAFLACGALFLMSRGGHQIAGMRVGETIFWGFASAAFFALTDVMVQQFLPHWGSGFFIPIMFMTLGVVSLGFIPFFGGPISRIDSAAWPWLLAGGVILAIQALIMALTLGTYGNATAVNILYSLRGLWSIGLIALWGKWLHGGESRMHPSIFYYRLAGALLLALAVALVVAGF